MSSFSLVLLATFALVRGMPSGAPPSACFSMVPAHGPAPQSSSSPFIIEPVNELNDGSFEVTVRTTSGAGFKGFLLMAFDNSTTDDSRPLGSFTPDIDGLSKNNPCGSPKGALTHTSRVEKDRLVVKWTPADDFEGFVVFKGTFVKTRTEFWVKERSPVVRVRREAPQAPQAPQVPQFVQPEPVAPIVPVHEAPAEVVPFVPPTTSTTTTTSTARPPTPAQAVDPIAVRTPAADSKGGNSGSSVEIMALLSIMMVSFSTAALVA